MYFLFLDYYYHYICKHQDTNVVEKIPLFLSLQTFVAWWEKFLERQHGNVMEKGKNCRNIIIDMAWKSPTYRYGYHKGGIELLELQSPITSSISVPCPCFDAGFSNLPCRPRFADDQLTNSGPPIQIPSLEQVLWDGITTGTCRLCRSNWEWDQDGLNTILYNEMTS